jgi:protein phosphatase
MKIQIYPPLYIHEVGQRPNQEDSLFPLSATADDILFVLCDGMGGHEHGEVASQTVCQALGTWFQNHLVLPLSDDQLADALAYAYSELDVKDGGEFKKMGTTLTLLYIDRKGVTALHMGDSRIYHVRPGVGILYQSRDHSIAFELYQSGEITYEEMVNYPQKNIVSRAMTPGKENRMRPDIIHITDVQSGDYFYLCSDGMLEQMSNGELFSILSSKATNKEKHQQLIDATIHNQDNHSAWLIHVKDVIREEGDELLVNEEPSARCNALNIEGYAEATNDVRMVEDEDEVAIAEYDDGVVPRPTPVVKRCFSFIKAIFAVFAGVLILSMTWYLFFQDNGNSQKLEPKSLLQEPITHQQLEKGLRSDTIQDTLKDYGTTRKQ